MDSFKWMRGWHNQCSTKYITSVKFNYFQLWQMTLRLMSSFILKFYFIKVFCEIIYKPMHMNFPLNSEKKNKILPTHNISKDYITETYVSQKLHGWLSMYLGICVYFQKILMPGSHGSHRKITQRRCLNLSSQRKP